LKWFTRHWKTAVAALVAFTIGAGLGASGESSESTEPLEQENQALEADVRQLETEIGRADARAERLETYRADALRYRRNRNRIEQEAQAAREAARERRAAEAEQRRRERQAALQAAQSTIEGDGTWQAGADFAAGIYRASASDDLCYWARLPTAHGGTSDIIENGLGSGTHSVQINEGEWFETARCGSWQKIG
jgi:TolA-binding protein